MENNKEKANLRKFLLENRDAMSFDLIKIASKQVQKSLRKLDVFRQAKSIASYYPIGSEVKTQEIMQEILSEGKTLALPKVKGDDLEFRKVTDFGNLEKAGFGIMEPKDWCSVVEEIDLVLVPTVGVTRSGVRLGYGFGYYDRFLKKTSAKTIALTYAKQIVRHIPQAENDVKVNWIVTENDCINASKEG